MTQNSEDLRVRRTRKLLQHALLELTAEKGFSNVTVSDLAEQAMINRSTFYRHYLDKYDLLSQYLDELSAPLESQADDAPVAEEPEPPPDEPSDELVGLLEHMQMNADFYRVMLGEKGDPAFCAQSFAPFIEKQIRNMLPSDVESADRGRLPIGLIVSYVLHAGMGAIVWWLEKGQSWAPEQIAVWLLQLSRASISLALEPDRKEAEDSPRPVLKSRPTLATAKST